jgi:hypothetical protein
LPAIKQNIGRLERAIQATRSDARKTLGEVIDGFVTEAVEHERRAA